MAPLFFVQGFGFRRPLRGALSADPFPLAGDPSCLWPWGCDCPAQIQPRRQLGADMTSWEKVYFGGVFLEKQ